MKQRKWATLDRGRFSQRLPKDLRFNLKGTIPEVIWIGPKDKRSALAVLDEIEDAKWVAVDTEYDMTTHEMIMWSLSDGKIRVAIHEEAIGYFKDWLEAPKPRKIMHNAIADLPVFAKRGIKVDLGADTMCMDFYVDENRNKGKDSGGRGHGLKVCALDWLGIEMVDFKDIYNGGKKPKQGSIPDLREKMLADITVSAEYASLDAYATYWLFALHRKILKATKTRKGKTLWEVYQEFEVPFLLSLCEIEQAGIAVDEGVLEEIGAELEKTVTRSRWCMRYLLPENVHVSRVHKGLTVKEVIERDKINTNSSQQMASIFYDVLGHTSILPDEPRTTKECCLKAWAEDGCLLSDVILSYRRAQKMRHGFVGYRKGDPRAAKNKDKPKEGEDHKGILHYVKQAYPSAPLVVCTHINPIGTVTGRLSNSEPNLQQIPSKLDKDPYRMRRAFTARPGAILVVADYDQAELRMLAHLSRDPVMVETFKRNGDIHNQTAKACFGLKCPVEQVKALHPDKRGMAKTINFGIVYGMAGKALARQLDVSEGDAERFMMAFFKQYRGLYKWIKATKALAHQQGYVETLLGRRRRLPNLALDRTEGGKIGQAERQAINAPIQGGVADVLRIAMARMRSDAELRGHEACTLLQVHDELIVECPELDAVAVRARVKALMEGAVTLRVPVQVDAHLGPHWEAAKTSKWEDANGYGQGS